MSGRGPMNQGSGDNDLEAGIRAALDREAGRATLTRPEWNPVATGRIIVDDELGRASARRRDTSTVRGPRLAFAAVAAAGLVVAGLAMASVAGNGTAQPAGGGGTAEMTPTTVSGMAPSTTEMVLAPPPVTLAPDPEGHGVPLTVVAGGERRYFRLTPDLDLAWENDGVTTVLCWRTPAAQDCGPESGQSVWLIPSSPGHSLIVWTGTGPGWSPGSGGATSDHTVTSVTATSTTVPGDTAPGNNATTSTVLGNTTSSTDENRPPDHPPDAIVIFPHGAGGPLEIPLSYHPEVRVGVGWVGLDVDQFSLEAG